MSVWDDEYGISVHAKHQTTKESISEILKGYQRENGTNGFEILQVKGWDYADLIATYEKAAEMARKEHVPVLVHVSQLTQPQGHSSSGSHERYKSAERLAWEKDYDCIRQMRLWMIAINIASPEELDEIDADAKTAVLEGKKEAWKEFINPIINEQKELLSLLERVAETSQNRTKILQFVSVLKNIKDPLKKEILGTARKVLRLVINESGQAELSQWIQNYTAVTQQKFSSHLHSESNSNVYSVQPVAPKYNENSIADTDGRMVIRDNFDALFTKYPEALVFGEDAGNIGDVNQGLEGMQEKYGELRVTDAGIREATIIGQGIGLALRGLRPIAEIQYLDYLLYAIQILSDDLATLQYRTFGRQKAPLIIRTRGHRLEGVWHAGSPMGMIINAIRGVHVLVPRNMTRASGFYNTLLKSDEPALVIECLNGYRLKEVLPDNIGEYSLPLGIPDIIREGTDVTLVTYGSCCRIAEEACNELEKLGISVELIDVQTLLPFDINHAIVESVKKTNKVVFLDEDVPSGATSFMMAQVIENQSAYKYLDTEPLTIAAKEHRASYGTDGDYFSKPNADEVFLKIYNLMHNYNPAKYPAWK